MVLRGRTLGTEASTEQGSRAREVVHKGEAMTARDILYILSRHKLKSMVFAVAVLAVVAYTVQSTPRTYESEAKLLLAGSANVGVELLKSRGFAQDVVSRLGVETISGPLQNYGVKPAYAEPGSGTLMKPLPTTAGNASEMSDETTATEAAIAQFMKTLEVKNVTASNIISLVYSASSPEQAQRILGEVVSAYVQKNVELNSTPASLRLLAEETERAKSQLDKAKAALVDFRERTHVTQFDAQQKLLLQRVDALHSQIQEAQAEYSGAHAAVVSSKDKLGLWRSEQEQRVRMGSLEASIGVLQEQLRAAEAGLVDMSKTQSTLEELDGQVRSAQEEYESYQSGLQRTRIAKTIESERVASVAVLENPTYQPQPQGRNMLIVAAGVLAAITGGLGIAFLLERLDHTIRTPKDIRGRLGLDCLASFAPVNVGSVRRRLRREVSSRGSKSDPTTTVPLNLADHVITWMYFVEEIRDSFEELRARIELLTERSKKRPYTLAVTSCYRGEGVSAVAAGLAYSVAVAEGEQVLLMNADRHCADGDGIPSELKPPNLTELRADRRMIEPPRINPQLFRRERINEYIAAVDGGKAFESILPSVERQDYKFVVLDLPSLREGGMAAIQAGRADGVILIIESENVRREVVQTGLERLEDAGALVLGAVLNRRKFYVSAWLYPVS